MDINNYKFEDFNPIISFFYNDNINFILNDGNNFNDEDFNINYYHLNYFNKYMLYKILGIDYSTINLSSEKELILGAYIRIYHESKGGILTEYKEKLVEIRNNELFSKLIIDNFIIYQGTTNITLNLDLWGNATHITPNMDKIFNDDPELRKSYLNGIKPVISDYLKHEEYIDFLNPSKDLGIKENLPDYYVNLIDKNGIVGELRSKNWISKDLEYLIIKQLNNTYFSSKIENIKRKLIIMKKFLNDNADDIKTNKKTLDIKSLMGLIQKNRDRIEKLKDKQKVYRGNYLIPIKKIL